MASVEELWLHWSRPLHSSRLADLARRSALSRGCPMPLDAASALSPGYHAERPLLPRGAPAVCGEPPEELDAKYARAPLPLRGHLPRPAGAGGGAAAHARGCRASAALLYYFVGRVRVFAASRSGGGGWSCARAARSRRQCCSSLLLSVIVYMVQSQEPRGIGSVRNQFERHLM